MTTALVTGATSGIGRALAIALAEAGYEVLAVGRSATALSELRAARPGVVPVALDLTDRAAVAAAVADLHVDVLINNAGVMPPVGSFADMAPADIDGAIEVNLSTAIVLTRLVVPQMRSRQSGHVLFTGSSAAHAPSPNFAVYAATKAALSSLAASLRGELSPFGVRVTEIVPGRVETSLYRHVLDADARRAMYAGSVAVQPEDVARMVVALLALPPSADVTRLDIMPTRPTAPIQVKTGATHP